MKNREKTSFFDEFFSVFLVIVYLFTPPQRVYSTPQ